MEDGTRIAREREKETNTDKEINTHMMRAAVKNRDSERRTNAEAEVVPNGIAFCIHPVKRVGRYARCTLQWTRGGCTCLDVNFLCASVLWNVEPRYVLHVERPGR
jgi:hypothetical protein